KADGYLPKPFNLEILKLRARNLVEEQQEKKMRFKRSNVVKPAEVTVSKTDKEFLERALSLMHKNLQNSEYAVEDLSRDLCMDRTGLYRKLKAALGITPSQFMRSIRLKHATQLLIQGKPVSEVSFEVGFASVSYFSKCFQEEFGVKPSSFRELENKAKNQPG